MKLFRTAPRRIRVVTAAIAFAVGAAACGSSSDTATTTPNTDATTQPTTETSDDPLVESVDTASSPDAAPVDSTATDEPAATNEPGAASSDADTTAGVEAAQWADNVGITLGDGTFTFSSDGLPSHELPDQFLVPKTGNMPPFDGDDISAEFEIADTDGLIVESPLDVEITLNPVYSDEVTLTSLSTIGVMISGAPLFNDYEDQGREFVAVDDNISLDGVYFIDACNGHPLASGDSYHYHGVPYCITDDVDIDGAHSTIIGVLRDGFPIYGPQGEGGVTLGNDDLDECSGHVEATPEYPEGIYHYHLTEDAAPYSIDCYHGVITDADTGGQGGQGPPADGGGAGGGEGAASGAPAGGAPDFDTAAATLGV
ncbi:YHYH protein, partial [Ilumatobacter sp.]|uniref:YHYH protein n=1 Tax=Ilumatobacter sp. TaxID=1967498 RepID=UPI003C3E3BEF